MKQNASSFNLLLSSFLIQPLSLMQISSYLLHYGKTAEFGRFESDAASAWSRGDRVIIQSPRGLELGTVLRIAPTGQGGLTELPKSGTILRRMTREDESTNGRLHSRGQELFADSRRLVQSLGLPMEVVDTEILLDGRQAYLHYLSRARFDARPLIEQTGDRFSLLVRLHNLIAESVEEGGCGACGDHGESGGCGRCSSGNCSSCRHGAEQPREPVNRISLA
jgi:cell fate regulator YaaT (PSP1 superfamily)